MCKNNNKQFITQNAKVVRLFVNKKCISTQLLMMMMASRQNKIQLQLQLNVARDAQSRVAGSERQCCH